MDESEHMSPSLAAFVAIAVFSLLLSLHFWEVESWLPIIDSANLAFHEAGHMFYGLFGNTMMWLGGTLGQLTFPVVAAIAFWRQRHLLGMSVAALWIIQNLFNIARYVADARAQRLPLAGGGEHDWTHLLSQWGVLQDDLAIARTIRLTGFLGLIVLNAWLAYCYWRDNLKPSASAHQPPPYP